MLWSKNVRGWIFRGLPDNSKVRKRIVFVRNFFFEATISKFNLQHPLTSIKCLKFSSTEIDESSLRSHFFQILMSGKGNCILTLVTLPTLALRRKFEFPALFSKQLIEISCSGARLDTILLALGQMSKYLLRLSHLYELWVEIAAKQKVLKNQEWIACSLSKPSRGFFFYFFSCDKVNAHEANLSTFYGCF